jgi:hypothetical protein
MNPLPSTSTFTSLDDLSIPSFELLLNITI